MLGNISKNGIGSELRYTTCIFIPLPRRLPGVSGSATAAFTGPLNHVSGSGEPTLHKRKTYRPPPPVGVQLVYLECTVKPSDVKSEGAHRLNRHRNEPGTNVTRETEKNTRFSPY